jgi:hypothetical protein
MRHDTPEYWTDLAKTAERGLFDAVFLADVIWVYDVYGGSHDTAIRTGAQAPTLDPFPAVPPNLIAMRRPDIHPAQARCAGGKYLVPRQGPPAGCSP